MGGPGSSAGQIDFLSQIRRTILLWALLLFREYLCSNAVMVLLAYWTPFVSHSFLRYMTVERGQVFLVRKNDWSLGK